MPALNPIIRILPFFSAGDRQDACFLFTDRREEVLNRYAGWVRGNWRTQQVKPEGFHIKRTLFCSEAKLRTDFLGWVKIPEGDCAQTHPKYSLTLNIKRPQTLQMKHITVQHTRRPPTKMGGQRTYYRVSLNKIRSTKTALEFIWAALQLVFIIDQYDASTAVVILNLSLEGPTKPNYSNDTIKMKVTQMRLI